MFIGIQYLNFSDLFILYFGFVFQIIGCQKYDVNSQYNDQCSNGADSDSEYILDGSLGSVNALKLNVPFLI